MLRLLLLLALGATLALAQTVTAGSVADRLRSAQAIVDAARWPQAEQLLRPLLAQDPDNSQALYLLGITLFHENQPRASLQSFTQAARRQAPSAAQLRTVAEDYVLLNDYDDADHWALRAVRQDPAQGESWYTLGRIRQTENLFADAVSCFTETLKRMPGSVKAANNLGLAYEGLSQPEKAIAAYRQALALQENEAHPSEQPFLNLGVLLTDRNQLDAALPLLSQAVHLAPMDPEVQAALGKLYSRQGDLSAAEAAFEQAVQHKPNDSALHFQLGQVYRREKKLAQASAELQRASALEAAKRH